MGFTRRNDASQPRIHPAPPQRNRLFGKKRLGVGKSHTVHFMLLAPNYIFFFNPRPTHCTCVTRYGEVSAPFAPKTSKLANISKNCQTNAWNRSVG